MVTNEPTESASLWITLHSSHPHQFQVHATCKSDVLSDRQYSGTVEPKVSSSELHAAYEMIRSAAQQSPSGRGPRSLLDPIKDLGARLFLSLFDRDLGRLYRESVTVADDRDMPLRVCISATEGSLVAELPWEFLYDPLRGDFLGLSSRRPILRQVNRDTPEPSYGPPSQAPARLAFVSSAMQGLEIERELSALQSIVKSETPTLDLTVYDRISANEFLEIVASGEFDVLHFAGHGYGQRPDSFEAQNLALGPTIGSPQETVSALAFASALRAQRRLRLIYLSACDTHRLAAYLTREIANVIGMRAWVSNNFCVDFAHHFYQALLSGNSIEGSVAVAREHSDRINPGGREWGMAVFCTNLRSPMSLFDRIPRLEPQLKSWATPSSPVNAREWQRLSQQRELYFRNLVAVQNRLAVLITAANAQSYEPTVPRALVGDLENQAAALNDTLKDIERQMQDLH